MIKVKNGTASREPIPQFLIGLKAESLSDLRWTDPSLGVQDVAWWPEEDSSPPLLQYERYGASETLTVDAGRKVVISRRNIVPWTAEEIAADKRTRVPAKVSRRQARQALLLDGLLERVPATIDAITDPIEREMARIEWQDSQDFERERPLVIAIGIALGLDSDALDALFIKAAGL